MRGESWEQGEGPLDLHYPLPLSCSSSLPSSPEPPWAPKNFLGTQEALGAFENLEQPWVFSQTQGPCSPCSPSPPSLSLSFPLAPPCFLSLLGSLGPSWGLSKLWKRLEAFGSLGSSGRLKGLASLTPPHPSSIPLALPCPLSLSGPPWVPGTFLGPQKALGAFGSLQQPWVFSQTKGPCFPCSPHPFPLTPPCSLSLPGPL